MENQLYKECLFEIEKYHKTINSRKISFQDDKIKLMKSLEELICLYPEKPETDYWFEYYNIQNIKENKNKIKIKIKIKSILKNNK
jgi:hypothetical protein